MMFNILLKVGNFYGASNDEYSQPRHCWDPSGKYIYSVSLPLPFICSIKVPVNIVADFPRQVYCCMGDQKPVCGGSLGGTLWNGGKLSNKPLHLSFGHP